MFSESANEPAIRCILDSSRTFGAKQFDCAMQRSRIRSPVQIDRGAPYPRFRVLRGNLEGAIKSRSRLGIAPQRAVAKRYLLKSEKVARIQFDRPLQVPYRLLPVSFTPVDVSGQLENQRLIRQRPLRDPNLRTCVIIVEITTIKKLSQGEVRLARVRAQTKSGLNRCVRGTETRWCMVQVKEVKLGVCARQSAVGKQERGIARDRLLEESNGFPKTCP